jgi:hypothetical protein
MKKPKRSTLGTEIGTRKSEDSPVVSARILNSLFLTGAMVPDEAR